MTSPAQTIGSARPFVKWAGGKSQLLAQYRTIYCKTFEGYYEPFLGGGAVFFDLLSKGRIREAVLSDSNADLMNLWASIRSSVDELVVELGRLQRCVGDENEYYEKRKEFNSLRLRGGFLAEPDVRKAALMFFLNKTCYNGLYRVNAEGRFNTPFGHSKRKLFSRANLIAVHEALKCGGGIELLHGDFEECTRTAGRGDFVYLDPPYQPLSPTSSFTKYTLQGFSKEEQARLASVFKKLDARGCYVMENNSYSKTFLRNLYHEYYPRGFIQVKAPRSISSVVSERGRIREFVIVNYTPHGRTLPPTRNSGNFFEA